ncbi:MAG: hypothetical protein ACYDBB_21965 [Armatimonadota bacterium]
MKIPTYLTVLFCLLCAPVFAQYTAAPTTAQWPDTLTTFQAEDCTAGPSAQLVDDAQAQGGKALAAIIGHGRAGHIFTGGWTPVRPDAKYEIAFRLRMDVHVVSPSDTAMPIYVGTEDKSASTRFGWPLRLEAIYRPDAGDAAHQSVIYWAMVNITDPKKVAEYQDYVIHVDRPPQGVIGFRAYWYGRAFSSIWIDAVKVRELPLPSEAEQLKGVKDPGALTVTHDKPHTLVVKGTYAWTYRLPELVGGPCDAAWAFPKEARELTKYDLVVFANVNLSTLEPAQRLLLSAFVQGGGAVLLLGGPDAYGKSWVHTSPLLTNLLPVQTSGLWDIKKAEGGKYLVSPAGGHFLTLAWQQNPLVYYFHQATPKAGAEVWLTATPPKSKASVPLLVVKSSGKGKVAAFLLTPFGARGEREIPLWEWKNWGLLLNQTMNTLRGNRNPEQVLPPGYQPPVVTTTPRPPYPKPREYPAPAYKCDKLQIAKVWPEKICYRPGENANGAVTVCNGTATPAAVTLTVSLVSGLDNVNVIASQKLTLAAGATQVVPVRWHVGGSEEFGRELRAELIAADGTLIERKGEYFTIGWNNYRVGQCRLVQPWTWDQGAQTFPVITPEDRWKVWLPGIRDAYATTTEYFFWSPDDFGNLTPTKDQWFSGQATYLISQADVHAVIDAAHAQGIAAVTYGKKWMSVSGMQAGRDGLELVREHPEWCEWDAQGHPKWWFDRTKYEWTIDQWRDYIQQNGKQGIGGVAVNCVGEDTVRYGCEEIVRSAKKFGWDGVRFDDHFTADSVFDGGLGFDGDTTERGQDYEKITVRNNRLTREIPWKYDRHFLVGFNYGGTYTDWGVRQPDAFVETCRDGQFVMIEHSVWWDSRTWDSVGSLLAQENHRVQTLGGVPGMVSMQNNDPQIARWEAAMNYASQGHYYNVRNNPEVVRYTRFMLRYGEVLYDPQTHFTEDVDAWVRVTPATGVLYRDYFHRRALSKDRQQLVLSLINHPGAGKVKESKLPVPPQKDVTVTVTVPAGWKVANVWRLDPDDLITPCVPQPTTIRENGPMVISIPELQVWNVLVIELVR